MKAAQSTTSPLLADLTFEQLQALPYPLLVARLTGEVVFGNGALHRLLGYSGAPPAFSSLDDLVEAEDLPDLRPEWIRTAAGAADVALNLRLRCQSGAYRWVRLSLSLYRGSTATPKVLGFISDIDVLLRGTENVDRLRIALEGAGQGVWDHDMVRGEVYFSPTWYRMRGFEAGEDIDGLMGTWFERLHPDDLPMIKDRTDRQNSGELDTNAFEYRERHRDGHWVWILSRGRPVSWKADGSVARIVGTDTDITALKVAELRLADEKERLRVTLQSVADGIVSTNAEGLVTYLNPAAAALCGWKIDRALGHSITEVYPAAPVGAVPDRTNHVVLRCLASQAVQTDSLDTVLRAGKNAPIDVHHTASPLISAEKQLLGAVLVFQDVRRTTALRKQLAHAALHDHLTGLPNRSAFAAAIEASSQSAMLAGREHALCYIDLDRFKAINDLAGHAAGDEVLKTIADLLKRSCRSQDFAGRVGGDEFVMLLSDCPATVAQRKCEELVDRISSLEFEFNGEKYAVGASIGIAAITRKQPSPGELTSRADTACYQAKSAGRGRVSIFVD